MTAISVMPGSAPPASDLDAQLAALIAAHSPVYAGGGGDFIHVAPQVIEGDITWLFAVNVQPVELIEQAVGVGLLSRWSVPLEQIQCISVNFAIRQKYPVLILRRPGEGPD